jgi:hypothetical protein
MEVSTTCLDNVVFDNAFESFGNFTKETGRCSRTPTTEGYIVALEAINTKNQSDTKCAAYTPSSASGLPSNVTTIWSKALQEYVALYDPCNPKVEVELVGCEDPFSAARPNQPTLVLVANVKVTSPYPCSAKRFVSEWVGSVIPRYSVNATDGAASDCLSPSCLCQGLAKPVCDSVFEWFNYQEKGVDTRLYAPTAANFIPSLTNPSCTSCERGSPVVDFCTP